MIKQNIKFYDPIQDYIGNYYADVKHIATGCSRLDKALGGGFITPSIAVICGKPLTDDTGLLNGLRIQNGDNKKMIVTYGKSAFFDNCKGEHIRLDRDTNQVEDIAAAICSTKPDMIFIDGFEHIRTANKFDSEYYRLYDVILKLREAARRADSCIIILSQLSQFNDVDGIPDLNDCEVLEEISDYIVEIYRPNCTAPSENELFALPKNKHGATIKAFSKYNPA